VYKVKPIDALKATAIYSSTSVVITRELCAGVTIHHDHDPDNIVPTRCQRKEKETELVLTPCYHMPVRPRNSGGRSSKIHGMVRLPLRW